MLPDVSTRYGVLGFRNRVKLASSQLDGTIWGLDNQLPTVHHGHQATSQATRYVGSTTIGKVGSIDVVKGVSSGHAQESINYQPTPCYGDTHHRGKGGKAHDVHGRSDR